MPPNGFTTTSTTTIATRTAIAPATSARFRRPPPETSDVGDQRCATSADGSVGARGGSSGRGLGSVGSYEELLARMRDAGCSRVFVKLAHGSSASGVVAFQRAGARARAITTVEMVPGV